MKKITNLIGLMQRAGKLITGEDLIIKNLKNKNIKLLIIAEDCGINTKKKLSDKAKFYDIEKIEVLTIDELSTSIGKDNRVAIGIIDSGFSSKLKILLEEGGRAK